MMIFFLIFVMSSNSKVGLVVTLFGTAAVIITMVREVIVRKKKAKERQYQRLLKEKENMEMEEKLSKDLDEINIKKQEQFKLLYKELSNVHPKMYTSEVILNGPKYVIIVEGLRGDGYLYWMYNKNAEVIYVSPYLHLVLTHYINYIQN